MKDSINEIKLTPMMRQYMDAKSGLPKDCVLLFRLGDFYELFFDDAVKAAPLLDVALTKRAGVPMCGVPYHAVNNYLPRLLDAGLKAAIAEQMEDPKTAKGIVKRSVIRILSPGTIIDETNLLPNKNNFLGALCVENGIYGLAFLDVSSGDFQTAQLENLNELENEFYRLDLSECIIPESLFSQWTREGKNPLPSRRILWTPLDDWIFCAENCAEILKKHFSVSSLDGFGCSELGAGISAAGAIIHYVKENLCQNASHVWKLSVYNTGNYAILDRATQRNLELVETSGTKKDAALLNVLDHTVTPMGARLLREWILRPLRHKEKIDERAEAVQAIKNDNVGLTELSEALSGIRDIQRLTAKLNVGNVNPRDMIALAQSVEMIPAIKDILNCFDAPKLNSIKNSLCEFRELAAEIKKTISDNPPAIISDGGFVKESFNQTLDELRKASTEGKNWMAELQTKEQNRTGIKSLKIKFNNVFGYYIEISKGSLSSVPPDYVRKQTIATGERFTTPQLKEMENKIIGAEEKAKALEIEIFANLKKIALPYTEKLLETASAIAEIDVIAGFATTAAKNNYSKPIITNDSIIEIKEGRHPILDSIMTSERFVPNDTLLDGNENQVIIITGPNMAGKSTYIRQVALIVIMAQIGSFVPAKFAKIGVADKIFTRVGASDDISRGQSTFMVEMIEAANILNNATPKSLVILDEIGRGTSTFDGISIAWAIAEYIHNTPESKARTLFATHYHELTELALTCEGVKNYNIAVKEHGENIIFIRKILEGATDKSYGVHVAKIAGLPKPIIERAYEILENLEAEAIGESGKPKLATHRKNGKKYFSGPEDTPLFDWAEKEKI